LCRKPVPNVLVSWHKTRKTELRAAKLIAAAESDCKGAEVLIVGPKGGAAMQEKQPEKHATASVATLSRIIVASPSGGFLSTGPTVPNMASLSLLKNVDYRPTFTSVDHTTMHH
jgi:hypothetical protein